MLTPIQNKILGTVTFKDLEGNFIAQVQNQLQLDWAIIASKCLGFGDRAYRISAIYVEYENLEDGGDTVALPEFGRDSGVEYYTGLAGSAVRDYLRISLAALPMPGVVDGTQDYYGDDPEIGNKLSFLAITNGSVGVNGLAFADGVNSKIFGVALAATPNVNDPTADLIFARTYLEGADQILVPTNARYAITWETAFL